MAELMFWGFVLRFVQCLAQASPFILTGFVVAAILKRFFGYPETRRLFGGTGRGALIRAWIIGMLLPVCSLGVIPVVRELRKAGLTGGTILAFAMAAPLFNPLSLLYGLTLSEPVAILSFAGCSLIIVTVVGSVWDKVFPQTGIDQQQQKSVAYGIRRMLAVGVSSAQEASGASLLYIGAGLAGVAFLGAVIPAGRLQHSFNGDNVMAPLVMSAMAIPVYATPMQAMSQLGMMFQHANSIGAAFVLLILGAGMNLGLAAWTWRQYGPKRTLVWFALLLTVVLGLAYGIQDPLFPKDIEPANHTHAFDIYSQPFHISEIGTGSLAAKTLEKLKRDIQIYEWHSLRLLLGLSFIGGVLRLADRSGRLEQWIEEEPAPSEKKSLDIVLPPSLIGLLCLAGLVALSVVGCYAYYPPTKEALAQMYIIRGEALTAARTGDKAQTAYWIEHYCDWSRKMEVGVYLRNWQLSDYHRWKARLLREQLELLKHEVEDAEMDEVRSLIPKVDRTHRRMRYAFTTEL
jgi:uncharacterized protein